MGLLSNICDIFPERGPELIFFSIVLIIMLIANMHTHDSLAQIIPAVNDPLINSTVTQDTIAQDLHPTNKTLTNTHSNDTSAPLPEVKITSHQKGQLVPVGTLGISGLSSDNLATTCDVHVILNNIKPYQKVASTAKGHHDYSSWNFTFVPSYSVIKEGNNKMTAKITCTDDKIDENVTKYNSLNVTGVALNTDIITNPSTSYLAFNNNGTVKPISPASHQNQIVPAPTLSGDGKPQQSTSKTIAQPNNQITPTPYLTEEDPNQYSSTMQGNQEEIEQQERSLTSALDDNEQLNSVDSVEVSKDMENIVNDFTEGVEKRIERQIEEIFTSKIPFQLATPFEIGN